MIKGIHQIKLKHIDFMERTGKVSQLKMWYNFLPSFLFIKQLQKLSKECFDLINGANSGKDLDIMKLEWKAKSLIKINQVEINYLICAKYLVVDLNFKSFLQKIRLTRGQRRKIKESDIALLSKAMKNIEVLTGIDIAKAESVTTALMQIKDEIIRLKAKYDQNFPVQKAGDAPKEKIYLLQHAHNIANYLGRNADLMEMYLIDFKYMNEVASKKWDAEQKQLEEINNKKNVR